MKSIEEIVSLSKPKEFNKHYIVFLLRENNLVFVGTGFGNPELIPLSKHNTSKKFDSFYYEFGTKEEVLEKEIGYILHYKPEYNYRLPANCGYYTVSNAAREHSIPIKQFMNDIVKLNIELFEFNGVKHIRNDDIDRVLCSPVEDKDEEVVLKIISLLGIVHTLKDYGSLPKKDESILYKSYKRLTELYQALSEEAIIEVCRKGYIPEYSSKMLISQRKELLAKYEQTKKELAEKYSQLPPTLGGG